MTISDAMEELVNSVRELGIGEYFDGLDYDNIIVNALDAYRRDIISRVDEIMEDMEIDSESDEPVQTEVYQDIDPNSTYGNFPEDMDDCIESDWCDFCEMSVQAEPVMGYLRGNCPHCGNMCS